MNYYFHFVLFWPYILIASGEKDLRVSQRICRIKVGVPVYSMFFMKMQKVYHGQNKW